MFYIKNCLVYLVGAFDADKRLSEGHRPEATVKEEQADVGVDMEEGGHIQVIGQSGRQTQNPDHALCGLHLPDNNNKNQEKLKSCLHVKGSVCSRGEILKSKQSHHVATF